MDKQVYYLFLLAQCITYRTLILTNTGLTVQGYPHHNFRLGLYIHQSRPLGIMIIRERIHDQGF